MLSDSDQNKATASTDKPQDVIDKPPELSPYKDLPPPYPGLPEPSSSGFTNPPYPASNSLPFSSDNPQGNPSAPSAPYSSVYSQGISAGPYPSGNSSVLYAPINAENTANVDNDMSKRELCLNCLKCWTLSMLCCQLILSCVSLCNHM